MVRYQRRPRRPRQRGRGSDDRLRHPGDKIHHGRNEYIRHHADSRRRNGDKIRHGRNEYTRHHADSRRRNGDKIRHGRNEYIPHHVDSRRRTFQRGRGQRRPYFVRHYDRQYSDRHDSRRIMEVLNDLNKLEAKAQSEIILTLGGNVKSLQNYLKLSGTNKNICRKLLMVLERGFQSKSTPSLLRNIINAVIEAEYITHTIESIKGEFERRCENGDVTCLFSDVTAVMRILIRIYEHNPKAVTFIWGSFDLMSGLMTVIRRSMEVIKPNQPPSDFATRKSSRVSSIDVGDTFIEHEPIDQANNILHARKSSCTSFIEEIDMDGDKSHSLSQARKSSRASSIEEIDMDFTLTEDGLCDKSHSISNARTSSRASRIDEIDMDDTLTENENCDKSHSRSHARTSSRASSIDIDDTLTDIYDTLTEDKHCDISHSISNSISHASKSSLSSSIDEIDMDDTLTEGKKHDKSHGISDARTSSLVSSIDEIDMDDTLTELKHRPKLCSHDRRKKSGLISHIEDSDILDTLTCKDSHSNYLTRMSSHTSSAENIDKVNNLQTDLSDGSNQTQKSNRSSCIEGSYVRDVFTDHGQSACEAIEPTPKICEIYVRTEMNESLNETPCISRSLKSEVSIDDIPMSYEHMPLCLEKIENLFARLDELKQECTLKREETSDCQSDNPIENFRDIPVFPRLGDLNGDIQPNLRVNKAKGAYSSVDDYLDVQFRLLREDFVAPLREGIMCYLGQTSGKSKKKIQEIKVYENVRIKSFICSDGLNYVLTFDNSKLKHIRWSMTKRLKNGSLVCLSADHFETCFFATVVSNDVKSRREGCVNVKFAERITGLTGQLFTMIESTAYFEAYRPVLASLQTIRETDLPFQDYIIKCLRDVLPPKYLRHPKANIYYDLRSLVGTDVKKQRNMLFLDSDDRETGSMFSDTSDDLKHVDILQSKWPKEDMLNLDISQLNALKTALTKEFSVIQGPPGCGKTHIGLQITKVLLHNKRRWRHENGHKGQLLVVCYTNHALDQFMEGICSFNYGNIIRVGGRSSNKNLERCNLKTIKHEYRKRKIIPKHIHFSRVEANDEVRCLQKKLSLESEKIKVLRENIVHEKSLYEEMSSLKKQFKWLEKEVGYLPPWLSFLDRSAMTEWLGIPNIARTIQEKMYRAIKRSKKYNLDDLVDEQLVTDIRGLVEIDLESSLELDGEQKLELKRFKEATISIDVESIKNVDTMSVPDSKKKYVMKEREALANQVQLLLRETKPMTHSEVCSVRDITRLTNEKRWALYLYWVEQKCKKLWLNLEETIEEYQAANDRLKEIIMMEEMHILSKADVIGMTITGAAIHKTLLEEIKPTVMIVEEAAEVLESHLLSNLTSGCQHLILIGDHKQLKPKPNVYRLETEYNMDISLFERMVRNGIRCDCLEIQHRMRPEIANNVRYFYNVLMDHESVKQYESVSGIKHNVYFINHCAEEEKNEELKSYTNDHEAKYLIALCKYLLLQGYDASNITMLTTYKGQMFKLKREMLETGDVLKDVKMTIVDNYQGEENDIILLSLVRSNSEGNVGFLKHDNRVCVALSRAKKGFFVIGNFNVLAEAAKVWNSIVTKMKNMGLIGKSLPLCCENHKNDEGVHAEKATDFQKAPEGGCEKPCEIRLECGHCCGKLCHIKNKEHHGVICNKPCARKCINGHQCMKKCWEKCVCEEEILFTLPRCGHAVFLKCRVNPKDYECEKICAKVLKCGHVCKRLCKESCICMEPIKVTLPQCGHETTIPCSVKPDQHKCTEYIDVLSTDCGHIERVLCRDAKSKICKKICSLLLDCGHVCEVICGNISDQQDSNSHRISSKCLKGHLTYCSAPCGETLKCGHTCQGQCSDCFRGRWHIPCKEACNCDLMCGHKCKGKCGYCVPCTERCTRGCSHGMCMNKCAEVCKPCEQRCSWRCIHFKCSKLCGEVCDRPRCNKPCRKLLPCKHQCIGMCGDPCPSICRVCDEIDVGKRILGTVTLLKASFVQLQDCGHIIECNILDKYMDKEEGSCLKRCPLCSEPIRTTNGSRYESTVNRIYKELNKVKEDVLMDNELYCTLTNSYKLNTELDVEDHSVLEFFSSIGVHFSSIFGFFDCRKPLNTLNLMAIKHFVKSVTGEKVFSLTDKNIFSLRPMQFISMQQLHEIERELKRYFDRRQFEKITESFEEKESCDLKVKEIVENANHILYNDRAYTECDREKVQNLIGALPYALQAEKRLVKFNILLADIDREVVVKNCGIKVKSLLEKEKVKTVVKDLKESMPLKESLVSNEVRHSSKEQSFLQDDSKPACVSCEYDQLQNDTSYCSAKNEKNHDLTAEDEGCGETVTSLERLDNDNGIQIDHSDASEINTADLGNVMEITNDEEMPVVPKRCINSSQKQQTKMQTTCESSFEKNKLHMLEGDKELSKDDNHEKKDPYNKEPLFTDEEPSYVLKHLRWSGYPYFNSKQSQFDLERIQMTEPAYRKDSGTKRKSYERSEKGPVEKRLKQDYRRTRYDQASEKRRRHRDDRDGSEPPDKTRKRHEVDSYRVTEIKPFTTSKTQKKACNVSDVTHVSSKTDTRRVVKKPSQYVETLSRTQDKMNIARGRNLVQYDIESYGDDLADQGIYSKNTPLSSSSDTLIHAPVHAKSSRTLMNYNDIGMFEGDKPSSSSSKIALNAFTENKYRKEEKDNSHTDNTQTANTNRKSDSKHINKTDLRTKITSRQGEKEGTSTSTHVCIPNKMENDLRDVLNRKKDSR